jgi:hypothetical protein
MSNQEETGAVTKSAPEVEPIRISVRKAAKLLGCGYNQMLELVRRKHFTTFDNKKRGLGRRIKLLTEEVKLYGREGEDALREHRARKSRARR